MGFIEIGFCKFYNNDLTIDPDFTIISDSSIYNDSDILKKLNIYNSDLPDDQIILRAFMKWGKDCLNYLIGDFAFAIWNKKTKELFCARDHIGVKPFYYYIDSGKFVFSSEISGITEYHDVIPSIDDQYIADTISTIKSESYRTVYNNIRKIPPAHYLIIKEGEVEINQYYYSAWNVTML